MKAVLRFNLPEERQEFETAYRGAAYRSVLYDLDQFLRNEIKHGNRPEDQAQTLQEIRDKLWLLCQDEDVTEL